MQSDEISSKYGVTAIAVTCDITNDSEQKDLFKRHTDTFNSLNFALLNAGVPEKGTPSVSPPPAWLPVTIIGPDSNLPEGGINSACDDLLPSRRCYRIAH